MLTSLQREYIQAMQLSFGSLRIYCLWVVSIILHLWLIGIQVVVMGVYGGDTLIIAKLACCWKTACQDVP